MKPTLFLRGAALVTALLGIGHTLGKPWVPSQDPLSAAVVVEMKSHSIHITGVERTLMDFYAGFGLTISVNLFMQAVLLWMVADLAADAPARARGLAAVFLIANAAATVLAGIYLFAVPLAFSAVVTLLLGLAVFMPWKGIKSPG
jgi:hypothetical protein